MNSNLITRKLFNRTNNIIQNVVKQLIFSNAWIIKSAGIKNQDLLIKCSKSQVGVILLFLKYNTIFSREQLCDLIIVDKPNKKFRFILNYVFFNLTTKTRIVVRLKVAESWHVSSITWLYAAAEWLECEAWEMFGVQFDRNKKLKRLLTDHGFSGFPLRKDFPVSGFSEVFYSDAHKKIITSTSLALASEFRDYKIF